MLFYRTLKGLCKWCLHGIVSQEIIERFILPVQYIHVGFYLKRGRIVNFKMNK